MVQVNDVIPETVEAPDTCIEDPVFTAYCPVCKIGSPEVLPIVTWVSELTLVTG